MHDYGPLLRAIGVSPLARAAAVTSLALLIAPAAQASEASRPAIELTPYAGYGIGGSFEDSETGEDFDIGEGETFGFIVNWQADPNTQYEVIYSTQSTDIDTSALFASDPILDIDQHFLQLGGTYLFEAGLMQPYVAITAGATHFDPVPASIDSETFVSFSVGAGVRVWPERRVGLRVEARYFGTFFDKGSDIFCRSDGVDNLCAVRVDGKLVNQWQAFVGLTVRL